MRLFINNANMDLKLNGLMDIITLNTTKEEVTDLEVRLLKIIWD